MTVEHVPIFRASCEWQRWLVCSAALGQSAGESSSISAIHHACASPQTHFGPPRRRLLAMAALSSSALRPSYTPRRVRRTCVECETRSCFAEKHNARASRSAHAPAAPHWRSQCPLERLARPQRRRLLKPGNCRRCLRRRRCRWQSPLRAGVSSSWVQHQGLTQTRRSRRPPCWPCTVQRRETLALAIIHMGHRCRKLAARDCDCTSR